MPSLSIPNPGFSMRGSLNVFTNRKLQKNARGYPLIESENFRKSHSAKKNQTKKTKRKKPLVSIYFWKHKKICGLVRESNPRSPASQKIS